MTRRGAAAKRPTVLKAAVEFPLPKRRPDAAVPLVVAAFFIGVVLASAAALGVQISAGDTVPANVHRDVVARLAGAEAATAAQRDRINAQGAALDDSEALARRLIDALGSNRVSAAELAALRASVQRQTRIVERTRVVPGPVVTVSPSPAPSRSQPAPSAARPSPPEPTAAATPAESPRVCLAEIAGFCLSR